MSKVNVTNPKHTRILHSPPVVLLPQTQEPALPPHSTKHWSPIPQAFWDSDSGDKYFDYQPHNRGPDPVPNLPAPVPEPPEDNQSTDSSSDQLEDMHTQPIISPAFSLADIFDNPDPAQDAQVLDDNFYSNPLPGPSST